MNGVRGRDENGKATPPGRASPLAPLVHRLPVFPLPRHAANDNVATLERRVRRTIGTALLAIGWVIVLAFMTGILGG